MTNRMPDIAVVIPTFNRERLVGRAVSSALNQTVPASQIIVVDDGSTDNTKAVCDQYGSRIEYVLQANAGASAARNRGIAEARCTWVAFLDSDDYWTPDHLERVAIAIGETNGGASLYFDDMELPDGCGTLWNEIGFRPGGPWHLIEDASEWAFMSRQPMMLQTSVFRKEALDRVGGLDVRFRLIHDSYLFCAVGIGGPACAVAGVGCVQTPDDTSATRLTTAIPLGSAGKQHEDALMWKDVLYKHPALPSAFRRLARCYAGGTYLGIGMNLLRAGHYLEGLPLVAKGVMIDPMLVLWILRHGSRRGYDDTVRPRTSEFMSQSLECKRQTR
jgi:glycosyltransferase involved in cell wall biosynthesis